MEARIERNHELKSKPADTDVETIALQEEEDI